MKLLSEVIERPSAFDSFANYMGDIPSGEWVCLLTRTRDAQTLTESNWRVALKMLGGESEEVEVHRFGHWACGWWEAVAVKKDTDAYKKALVIEKSLENYPLLDDEDYNELQDEQAQEVWKNCFNAKDRIKYIREHGDQFEFNSFADIRSQVKGEYFGGYASELID